MRRRWIWVLAISFWLAGTLVVTWIGFLYHAQWFGWILAVCWGLAIGKDFGPAFRRETP